MEETMKLKLVNMVMGHSIMDYNSDKEAEEFFNDILEQPLKNISFHMKVLFDRMVDEIPEEQRDMTIFEYLEMIYSEDD